MFFFNFEFFERNHSTRKFTLFLVIFGNTPLLICFVLKSKNMFTIFTICLTRRNNYVFKTVAKMLLLFPLELRN